MARHQISARQLERGVYDQLGKRKDIPRHARRFANQVQEYARNRATHDMLAYNMSGDKGGYYTGRFVQSIKVRRISRAMNFLRGRSGKYWPAFELYSNDPKAHFLEYGTKIDNPASKSPWGRFTPTPEYATFGKTAFHFRTRGH